MILDKCTCGETALTECPNCGHVSFCPNCAECLLGCEQSIGRKRRATHHITVRIDHELYRELDGILQEALKGNPFATKSDVIRELIKAGIERG